MHYDVFNGDADGIIALLQLRKAEPKKSQLITGVKRDIKLVDHVSAASDVTSATVLDVSMEKNASALSALLERDIPVFYCDHHRSGDIPTSENLTALVDLDAQTCTCLLINKHLEGAQALWAVVGAYGDNLFSSAEALADELGLVSEQREFLKELGTLINYNGYGASLDDLHIAPAELFNALMKYNTPFDLLNDDQSPFFILQQGYAQDFANLEAIAPSVSNEIAEVYELPNEAWARRVSGVFGNALANKNPDKAHAVLTLNQNENDFTVSVRAPLNNRTGADEVCSQFATGGGRKAAAGVNQLSLENKNKFVEVLTHFYQTL